MLPQGATLGVSNLPYFVHDLFISGPARSCSRFVPWLLPSATLLLSSGMSNFSCLFISSRASMAYGIPGYTRNAIG